MWLRPWPRQVTLTSLVVTLRLFSTRAAAAAAASTTATTTRRISWKIPSPLFPAKHRKRLHADLSTTKTTTTTNDKDKCDYKTDGALDVIVWATVLPAPKASAAGVRTWALLQCMIQSSSVSSIHFVTPSSALLPSKPTQNNQEGHTPQHPKQYSTSDEQRSMQDTVQLLKQQGVHFHQIPLNRENSTKQFLTETVQPTHKNTKQQPICCIFDRFYTEEMYAHYVHRYLPDDAILVLDMQDMHSLRHARQRAVAAVMQQKRQQCANAQGKEVGALDHLLPAACDALPDTNDEPLLRELASIHRCDLTLVCSPYEQKLLQERYNIPPHKLVMAPLLSNNDTAKKEQSESDRDNSSLTTSTTSQYSFRQRQDVCFVGGFRHEPNVHAVDQLVRLWPRIRHNIMSLNHDNESPCLRIYGAFLTSALQQRWTSILSKQTTTGEKKKRPSDHGICWDGFTPKDISVVLQKHRLLLAPLTYGAGLKGKLMEAWKAGLPVVTTPIGMEGFLELTNTSDYEGGDCGKTKTLPGAMVTSDDDFVARTVELYTRETEWIKAHNHAKQFAESVATSVSSCSTWSVFENLCQEATEHRKNDTTRAILWRESLRSTEHFARYLELKERENQ